MLSKRLKLVLFAISLISIMNVLIIFNHPGIAGNYIKIADLFITLKSQECACRVLKELKLISTCNFGAMTQGVSRFETCHFRDTFLSRFETWLLVGSIHVSNSNNSNWNRNITLILVIFDFFWQLRIKAVEINWK